MEEDKYIKKWLADELTEQEARNFKKSSDYPSLTRLDRALNAFKSPDYRVEEELQKSHDKKAAISNKGSWIKTWMKIAASILLLSTVAYILMTDQASDITRIIAKNKESVLFPDSSTVILNKGSVLTFQQVNWDAERKVKLEGEGFFDVKKGSSFEVITTQGSVKVLGTSFNVIARSSYFGVDCYHGKVAVKKDKKTAILQAEHRVQFIDGIGGEVEPFKAQKPAWMNDESSFERVPLKVVLKEFERQYEVRVQTGSINVAQSFSGSFTHTDINLAIRSITVPLNLRYEINGSVVILLSESPN